MLALTHRLIAALLFVLVANPICCCGMETAPKCCLPADAENDDTNTAWEYQLGANYQLTKQLGLSTGYHSEHGFGGGLSFSF